MKKILPVLFILLLTLFIVGLLRIKKDDILWWREKWSELKDEWTASYKNELLGVSFNRTDISSEDIVVSGNQLYIEGKEYLQIFQKSAEEPIEQSILSLAKEAWADEEKCKVTFWRNVNGSGLNSYAIELKEYPVFTTEEETYLNEVPVVWDEYFFDFDADEQLNQEELTFIRQQKEKDLFSEKTMEICSRFAERAANWFSRSVGAFFLYNDATPQRFAFTPSSSEINFFVEETIEFMK